VWQGGGGREGVWVGGREGGPTYHDSALAQLGRRVNVDRSQISNDTHSEAREEAREEGQAPLPQGV